MTEETDLEEFDPLNREHIVSLANMLHCMLNGDPDHPGLQFAFLLWPSENEKLFAVFSNDRDPGRVMQMLDEAKLRVNEQPQGWPGFSGHA
jgi:hypothetical protein